MEIVIFACGDSFTAGEELSDDLFYTNVGHEDITFNEWRGIDNKVNRQNMVKAWFQRKNNTKLTREQQDSLMNENRNRAYPAKIAMRLSNHPGVKCTVHNYACGGASQEWINREIIDQYLNETKHGRTQGKRVIFLIGTTSVNRIQYFNETVNYWSSILLSNEPARTGTQIDAIRKTAIMHEHEDVRLHKWLLSNLLLKTFCQSKGIELYFVRSVTEMAPDWLVELAGSREPPSSINWAIQQLYKELDIGYLIDLEDIAKKQDANKAVARIGGHVMEYIHDIAADNVYNYFVSKYSL